MERIVAAVIVALVLTACSAPTAPGGGEGGRTGNEYDWYRRMMCEEAEDRMHYPARYDSEDPMRAEMIGREMYNDWQCDQLESEINL